MISKILRKFTYTDSVLMYGISATPTPEATAIHLTEDEYRDFQEVHSRWQAWQGKIKALQVPASTGEAFTAKGREIEK